MFAAGKNCALEPDCNVDLDLITWAQLFKANDVVS